MATLNLPAWGDDLYYRYDLFKQLISMEGQEKLSRIGLSRKWAGGALNALTYDVSIPGYKRKKCNQPCVWAGKQKHVLRISTYFSSKIVSMSQLINFVLEHNRFYY